MILEMLLIALFVFIILIKKMNVLSSSFAVFMLVGVLILLYANLQNTIIFASYNSRFDFEYTLYKLLVSVRVNSIFAVKWLFVSGVVVYLTSDYLMIALCFEKKLTFSKLMLLILFCVLGAIFIYFNSPKMSTYIYELSYKIKFYIRLANSIKIFNFFVFTKTSKSLFYSSCISIVIQIYIHSQKNY